MPLPEIRLDATLPSVWKKPFPLAAPPKVERKPPAVPAAFCPPWNRLLMPPSRPPVRFPLPPTEPPSSRFPAPLKRLSMPGANFMPTNTAASLPSVEATCGPLFAR